MSSTLLLEDTGVSFDRLQAEQIAAFREAWAATGWQHEPRVSVSRSVIPIVMPEDKRYFGRGARDDRDQLGYLDGAYARFGRSYTGPPDEIADELSRDEAVLAADTLLLTIPNQLGVDYNAHLLETILREIAPALGWHRDHGEPRRDRSGDRPLPPAFRSA
jgi:alkanesulfonate monooxygenase SsuD/methylene tetrahydromethanopterin reductase-like flavin-dependent oxidoreductase (luciferase family)